jgi:hypothetical protein
MTPGGIDDVTELRPSPSSGAGAEGVTLRLLWPQWQGAGTASVRALAPKFPFEVARRGYAVGSAVLAAVLPAYQGPTVAAPVAMDDTGLELADGIEAKQAILTQLAQALEVIRQHEADARRVESSSHGWLPRGYSLPGSGMAVNQLGCWS